ncbi:MAG TPA: restriction endonuclease subunit S [Solirubrobacterales bacterium]|nr:restriction endonuclease subunit S [Solirubrobacterales bacterium]
MISDLGEYPSYRTSGVPVLGRMPTEWEVRRAKFIFRELDERSVTGSEQLLTVSSEKGVIPRAETEVTMFQAESYVGHKLCWPGDLVINSLWAWAGGFGFSKYHGIVSTAYGVYRLRGGHPATAAYLHRALRSGLYEREFAVRSRGIWTSRLQLTDRAFLDMPIVLPPLEDQLAIVRFLDFVGSRIQRLVVAKEKLIELLVAEKRAIIYRVITSGLDPYARFEPSGVAWLGDVPSTWDIIPLRLRYSARLGKMLDAKRITGTSLLPYLRNTDVQWDRINAEALPEMDISRDERDRYTVKSGDLLVCEGGEVGRAAIWDRPEEVGYQKALHRLRPYDGERDKPRFLYYVLRAMADLGLFKADGSENTIAHLTAEKLRRLRMPFPPAHEQEAIASQLDGDLKQRETAIASARSQIDLLREFRTRLISDVVTGKLDVREVAGNLPDDSDADAPAFDEPLEEVAAG